MFDREHRKYKRSRFVFPVRIGVLPRNAPEAEPVEHFHAFSNNISEGGLKITLARPLEKDLLLELRFDLIIREELHLVRTRAHIHWSHPREDGTIEYGLVFEKLPENEWKIVTRFMEEYCRDVSQK